MRTRTQTHTHNGPWSVYVCVRARSTSTRVGGGGVRRLRRHSIIVTHPPRQTVVVLRPRPRPTAGRDTRTTNRHAAARRTAGGSIRRDRNTVYVRPLPTTLVRWLARSIHTPETLQRAVAGRGRVGGMASGLFVSIGWVEEWTPRTIFPTTKRGRAHPIFHYWTAAAPSEQEIDGSENGVWYALSLPHVSAILFYARKPFDKKII